MRQSNSYIVFFALALCIVVGGLLSLAAVGLKPAQDEAKALDTKKQILGAVIPDVQEKTAQEVNDLYDARIESLVVDSKGDVIEGAVAEKVDIKKEFKKDGEERQYPVYKYKADASAQQVDAYILPIYGKGLWDSIWGYIALESDLNTIKGIVFDHAGETPGLGARITSSDVQMRYQGKKIKDEAGEFKSITMLKGENNAPENLSAYEVDGMSGATLTANGVNDMVKQYLSYYMQGYFVKVDKSEVAQ